MIVQTTKLTNPNGEPEGEKFVDGYFLTLFDLARLVRDFQADCHDGFVSNDLSYLENWLKNHNQI